MYLASTVPHTPLTQLLPPDGILGQNPTPRALRLPLLGQLRLRHPLVARHSLAAGSLSGGSDLRLPGGMAVGGGLIAREHAQAPEGKASREWHVPAFVLMVIGSGGGGVELNARDLEVPEVWGPLAAVAHDDELDLRQDEAVAGAVLAHGVVQVREPPQVLHALHVALDAHPRVEAVEALDEPHDAGRRLAAEDGGRRGGLARHVGHEDVVVGGGGGGG